MGGSCSTITASPTRTAASISRLTTGAIRPGCHLSAPRTACARQPRRLCTRTARARPSCAPSSAGRSAPEWRPTTRRSTTRDEPRAARWVVFPSSGARSEDQQNVVRRPLSSDRARLYPAEFPHRFAGTVARAIGGLSGQSPLLRSSHPSGPNCYESGRSTRLQRTAESKFIETRSGAKENKIKRAWPTT